MAYTLSPNTRGHPGKVHSNKQRTDTPMQTQTTRRSPEDVRWIKAAGRAIGEGVRVFQLASSGQWIATSGSEHGTAYELDVTGSIAHGCSCLAGLNDDPVCKHRAAFYLSLGALPIAPREQTAA